MTKNPKATLSSAYRLNPVVAIEDFGDASLALHCVDLQLIELNATARDLIAKLDGRSILRQIAAAMANKYDQDQEMIEADIAEIATQLLALDIIERAVSPQDDPNDGLRPTSSCETA